MSDLTCKNTRPDGQKCGGVINTCSICQGRYCGFCAGQSHGPGKCNVKPRQW